MKLDKNKVMSFFTSWRKEHGKIKETNKVLPKSEMVDVQSLIQAAETAKLLDSPVIGKQTKLQQALIEAGHSNSNEMAKQQLSQRDALHQSQQREIRQITNPKPEPKTSLAEAAAAITPKTDPYRQAPDLETPKGNLPDEPNKPSWATNNYAVDASKGTATHIDPLTNEILVGRTAKYPTRTGGVYVTNVDMMESYYLLFTDGKVFILTSIDGIGKPMSILYRLGKGTLSQADMDSIVEAKLPLTRLLQYYKIIPVRTHGTPGFYNWGTNVYDFGIPELFRLDTENAKIIW
jgi:hypothetical protein